MTENKAWLKIIGWVLAGAFMVAGWIYAGIMSGYTARIVRLEATAEINRTDIRALQLQSVRFEEMFKSINEKLEVLIQAHRE